MYSHATIKIDRKFNTDNVYNLEINNYNINKYI